MPGKIKHVCNKIGCPNLTTTRYCEEHQGLIKQEQKQYDKQRGNSNNRGYIYEWRVKAKRFLSKPENQFCKLRLKGCTGLAQCPDHIIPVTGPDDPRFFDESNWQSACNHCNRLKGDKIIDGTG